MYSLGAYRIDVRARLLSRAGENVLVEPRVFDLLVYLVRNRDRCVSKEELLRTVWADRPVRADAVAACVRRARRALGGSGDGRRIIQTVHSRGFRFILPSRDKSNFDVKRTDRAVER